MRGLAGQKPHREVHLGCVQHRVQRDGCVFPQGTAFPWNAKNTMQLVRCYRCPFSRRQTEPERGSGPCIPIRIKLRKSEQYLVGVGRCLAGVQTATRGQTPAEMLEHLPQIGEPSQGAS